MEMVRLNEEQGNGLPYSCVCVCVCVAGRDEAMDINGGKAGVSHTVEAFNTESKTWDFIPLLWGGIWGTPNSAPLLHGR